MIKRSDFLSKYRIDAEKFKNCGLGWNELSKIADDYEHYRLDLEPTANYIAESLRKVDAVHSLKIRLKDPEHLIEKIIRKKLVDSTLDFSVESYKTMITDLIGIRALHLFKEDWIQIHNYITRQWEQRENPTANIRKGDDDILINEFQAKGCEIKEHPDGYRSIHYLVQCQPTKFVHIVEIQVRTIFEEGWSEIDHRVRYPYDMDDPLLSQYLFIFNRLAGSADEMGSFVRSLKVQIKEISRKAQEKIEEKVKTINDLSEQIKSLKIEKKEKDKLEAKIKTLSAVSSSTIIGNAINTAVSMMGFGALTDQSIFSGVVPIQKCSKCGKDITGASATFTFPPLCSDCRNQSFILGFSQKCSECGKDITGASTTFPYPPLCSDCRNKALTTWPK
jgi:ppGpp synthetase/RelA/SpoT-type nucleotidyltranferase/endogenous inhibitor of DNA gyrase (YacG/DUF329 family)